MDAATVAETTVASLEGLSVPIVIVDVLKGHCFLSLAGTVVLRTCRARILSFLSMVLLRISQQSRLFDY